MPLTPEEYYANALAPVDATGKVASPRMTKWRGFPFELEGLRVVPLGPPLVPEAPRRGEGGEDCDACNGYGAAVWEDERWRLITFAEPSGAPLILLLQPKAHHDLPDLPDELAKELGLITVHLTRAIESLSHVARAHVSRWGDGGAHLHVFFLARPEGFEQLRGTFFATWDDLLTPVPREVRDADARSVARSLAGSYGGTPNDD